MSLAYIFSLVFFIAFAIYYLLGLYTLSLNMKNILNRVFFAICLSLCIWTFSFSINNSAPDFEMALFWRRMSSLGWGTLFGFILHFLIILTERSELLKNKWLYILLYLPGAVTVFIFGIYHHFAANLYNLTSSAVGWVNISTSSWWFWYIIPYYLIFCFTGLWLLWHWGRSSKDPGKKKQAYLLITTFAITVITGTMTEVIVNKYMSFNVPQMAPVIGLLPITVVYYAIRRHGLMGPEKSQTTEPGKILSEVNLAQFYQIISMVFIIGGMFNFAIQYFIYRASLKSVLLFTMVLFIYSIALQVVRKIPKKADLQENAFIFLVATSIPLFSIWFIEYASVTVWAVPFIFLIISVVYNKRRMMYCLGICILFTQIWVWMKVPTVMVQVDVSDHLARIGIFIIAIWLAFYVNRLYIQRLEENEAQIRFQKMLSQISADFVKITESNLDEKINSMLQLSGQFFQLDQTCLFGFSSNLKTYEWCNEGTEPVIFSAQEFSLDAFPWWVNQIVDKDELYIPDVEMLPPEACKEKELLKQYNIQSLLAIPVNNKVDIFGLLCFVSVKEARIWRRDHQDWLRIMANILTDALVKVKAEKEISYMAYYDAVTELPNRTLFKNRLEHEIYLARRTGKLIGVVFIDLDFFKTINDTMGHDVGDEILKQVAYRLSECLRNSDAVSRFGGDEFLIMFTQIARAKDIHKLVDRIMKSFAHPMIIKDQEYFITASAGIAIYPEDGEESEVLIKNADLAMYASKDKGKNQYTLCSPVMKEKTIRKMQLTNNLYRAQERNELELYYQPLMSISAQEIIGFEALIRWNHPELGMISPRTFIPLAEQSGLINSIGKWMLQTACRQNREWQVQGLPSVRMAVNLSVEQFRDPNLINLIATTLNETGLESKYLELEITESIAVKEENYIVEMIFELKKLGVTIAIDDFGTKYSSLNRLKTLPVDRIKIDMQFVHGIAEGNKDEAIAKTIIQLAKNLNLKVIAEGVETKQQLDFFSQQMCDEVQGFYYYKPMPAIELERILISQLMKK